MLSQLYIDIMKSQVKGHLKTFRLRAELTQQELAQQVGVSRQSIISIERGHYIPSLPLALRFARLFDCSTDALFELVEEGNSESERVLFLSK
jgi:putative transcriptional regulator